MAGELSWWLRAQDSAIHQRTLECRNQVGVRCQLHCLPRWFLRPGLARRSMGIDEAEYVRGSA